MQHQLKQRLLDGIVGSAWRMWLAGMLLLLLLFTARVPAAAQEDGAQLRLGHFVLDGPTISLYMDGAAVTRQDGDTVLYYAMTVPAEYLDLAVGVHTFALAPEDETLDSSAVVQQEFTLAPEHRYLLALMGNVTADDLHLTLIDETDALAQKDINMSAVSIIINNLTGITAIDGLFAGEPFFTNLAYGEYAIAQDPTTGSGTLIISHDNPDAIIMEVPEAVGSPAHFFAVFVFSGTFSGAQWDGYTVLYTGKFEGELTISDGGAITLDDSLPVEFTGMGERVRFVLTLEAPATVDILLSGEAGADAFVRLYDEAGNMTHENDELSMDDNSENVFDAGWHGLSLEAGTYIIEAATFADIGAGSFTLSLSAAR